MNKLIRLAKGNYREIYPKHRAYQVRARVPMFIRIDKFGNELHFNNVKEVKAFYQLDKEIK